MNQRVVKFVGNLDNDGAVVYQQLITELATENQDVLVDLTGVNYLDGSGVGAIAYIFKRLQARGYNLTVQGATGQPRRMLWILGIGSVLGADERGNRWHRFLWFVRNKLFAKHSSKTG